ncbi:uncharacterized protein BYT42DRAFT_145201 [Radiomyces spectabilis]|uniref:uncharacterized protein n=1 Tax=Radiomyces spectabilis TaxID=64574 RepID=UPI00221F7EDB|nr:uncharacterized protein BYT42DRAFT_145201 [Radiomyces spectabilis]KAI8365906.1 hypothetical protein BYT42DRAFT_145201 [Radiomyces spectabilis]
MYGTTVVTMNLLGNTIFTNYETLVLYLLHLEDDEYKPIKVWSDLQRTRGVLVQQVDDSWFPEPQLPDNSPNKSWTMYAYMLGPDVDLQEELAKIPSKASFYPVPTNFTLIQNARNTTQPSATPSTVSTQQTNNDNSDNKTSNSGLQTWVIVVIVIACVLVVGTAIAIFWAVRKVRKNKAGASNGGGGDEKIAIYQSAAKNPGSNDETSKQAHDAVSSEQHRDMAHHLATFNDNRDISSIHSSTPMILHGSASMRSSPVMQSHSISQSLYDRDPEKSAVAHLMQHPEARQSSSILSSTDALMIADTFRQFMRKPEWTDHDEEEEEESVELKGKTTKTSS